MINVSAQNMLVVVSRDSVLDLAPIVIRNLSVGVAVAIHCLGNQLINFGNFMLQFKALSNASLSSFSFVILYFFFPVLSFPMLKAMALEAAVAATLFAVTVEVYLFSMVSV
jgi:hypothetical protein